VEDARGLDRPLDRGEEDLDALAEEIARLPELPTVAAEHPVREVLEDGGSAPRAGPGSAALGPDAAALVYPEWNHRRGGYRLRGCLLRERGVPAGDAAWVLATKRERAALFGRVRRHFEAIRPRRRREPRRIDGDGVDVDAFVEELAERRAGREPSGRLYTQDRRARRDVAVALLLDASGSTEAWVSKRQRVIDVAKEAALCFCEALAALGDRLAVYACSGRGAGDVRVQVAKRFEDRFGDDVLARIGALEPDHYTRLGAPIRHATAALARTGARVQLLLLLSDGKPNDEDAYAGEYGIEDVRQAVAEARALGVRPFCITIDREGPGYLPRLFGPSGYTLLWDVEQLPLCLPRVYARLTAAVR
jgi:nitric oxide reductase NorD protein